MAFQKYDRKDTIKIVITAVVCIVVLAITFAVTGILSDLLNYSDKSEACESYVKIVDVGQGDCILIHSRGRTAIIDTGIEDYFTNVVSALGSSGIKKVDLLLLSHLDNDHCGSATAVCNQFDVKNLILPELSVESEGIATAEGAIFAVNNNGGEVYTAVPGMYFSVGDFTVTVLAQLSDMPDENNRSIVAMAEIAGNKFLFTGDIERKAELEIINSGINLDCDVLKVAHHGSRGSTSIELLAAATPRFAAISVGADNRYGHPHIEAVSRLNNIGAAVNRTDKDGSVTYCIDNGKITVKTAK